MTHEIALTWYTLRQILLAAQTTGDHVRQDWIDAAGCYGASLPRTLTDRIEQIDWSRVADR